MIILALAQWTMHLVCELSELAAISDEKRNVVREP